MSEVCNDSACDTEGSHEHCKGCDCILSSTWDSSDDYCCWCVERIKKEGAWKECAWKEASE